MTYIKRKAVERKRQRRREWGRVENNSMFEVLIDRLIKQGVDLANAGDQGCIYTARAFKRQI